MRWYASVQTRVPVYQCPMVITNGNGVLLILKRVIMKWGGAVRAPRLLFV